MIMNSSVVTATQHQDRKRHEKLQGFCGCAQQFPVLECPEVSQVQGLEGPVTQKHDKVVAGTSW